MAAGEESAGDMHIGVLFPMDTVRQSLGRYGRMWGRVVANHDFLQALIQFGSHARLSVFVATAADAELLTTKLLGPQGDRVDVVPYVEIASHLRGAPLDVLHVPDPNLFAAAHIRNFLSDNRFVVTGMTHSLANQHFLGWALHNHANGVGVEDCLVCTSPTAAAVVESMLGGLGDALAGFRRPQTCVIPLGVSGGAALPERSTARNALQIGAGDFVMLSLSRFDPHFKMDLLPLLELADIVRREAGSDVRLLLAGSSGDGAYAQYLRERAGALAADQVVNFHLDCDEQEKSTLFAAADVFVSLSDNVQETFGLTVVEALQAGLPVIASDWNGYRGLVRDGIDGFLIPTMRLPAQSEWEAILALYDDPLAHLFCAQATAVDLRVAADRALQLAADAGLRARFGEAARLAAGEFQWSAVIEKYEALWAKLRNAQVERPIVAGDSSPLSSAIRFIRDFSAYPTSHLSPAHSFRTSAAGLEMLSGVRSASTYASTEEFLDQGLMLEALRQFSGGHSVQDLLGAAESEPGRSSLKVMQNILWLYKRGFLEAVGLEAQ